jgi:ATP-dependent RNA helicase DeaD
VTETALPLPLPETADRPTFDALPLSPEIRRAVDELGFTHPTPVQLAVYEPAVAATDLVVQARTGTGKTAAFGLPIVDRLVDPRVLAPQVLVLAPTRELALQISRELTALARHKAVSCVAIYGGAAMQPQIDALRAGAQIVVGTPGRVLDHFERGTLARSGFRILVLDESDEMLSMGFLPQITRIMEYLPAQRQTLLFSATLPPDVRRIADSRLREPVFITLSGDHVGALSIQHFVYRSRGAKPDELVQVILAEEPESAIVFCNTRDQTKRIASALKRAGYSADWLNADLAQSDREKVMHATRQGNLRFLVATDVAARGIDISHLTHVINADFPESTENYVHRTGRTGRAGRTGTAISLIAPQDVGNLYMLRLTYKIFPIERELPSQRELSSRREADLVSSLAEELGPSVRAEDLSLARRVLQSDAAETIVAGLLRARIALSEEPGRPELDAQGATTDLEDGRKKHKKEKKKDRKRKDRQHDDAETSAELPSGDRQAEHAESERSESEHTWAANSAQNGQLPRRVVTAGPTLEVVSASQILGGSVESLLNGAALSEAGPRESAPRESRASDELPLERAEASVPPELPAGDVARIFVNVGKRDGVSAQSVRSLLEEEDIHPDDIDFIAVKDNHTFLGVASDLVDPVLKLLNDRPIGGAVARAEVARPRRR